jgi:hypothetical protein
MSILLTRDTFRESVFKRDGHLCVICKAPAKDAHHILERRLWDDGGYYLDNGSSLCSDCHMKAETTELSCDEIRKAIGIETPLLPEHLYRDNEYDKWGNVILPNKSRTKGELFHDESVQKVLAGCLHLFTDYVKYSRTYHLPFSEGRTKDDKVLKNCSQFDGEEVVYTEKMDGENTTIYQNYMHARSLDDDSHPSRDWVKNFAARIAWELPEGWRLCGENVFAQHAIHYDELDSYFYLFSIWNEKNYCLPWDEMVDYAGILGIPVVPVLGRGIWDEKVARDLAQSLDKTRQEGFVVRTVKGFGYGAFRSHLAKFVRKNHVAATVHNWKMQMIVPNKLRKAP